MGSRFLMKICVFNGDAFLSGANMSLVDWIKNDTSNEYWIILPKSGVKSHDFDNIAKNVHVVNGNYFATAKHLRKKSGLENVKLTIKSCYMKVCYKQSIRKRLLSLIQDISPDVILSNTFSVWIGADIATSLDIPHFWHVREFMDFDHGIEHENLEMIRDLASKSNAIFISKAIESYYLKKYKFKSSKVIYNQISYNKNIVNENPRFNDKKVRAIFVGQLLENKGVMDAVKAASKVYEDGYEFSLDIYGKGSLENTLRKYINDNSISNVHLKGFTKDISTIRRNYDMELVCSKMEALGRVTIEGMYYRNLVIGADSGATAELVKDGITGYLYKSGNIDDLVKNIEKAIASDDSNKIIINAHEWSVKNFSNNIAPKIISFIEENRGI